MADTDPHKKGTLCVVRMSGLYSTFILITHFDFECPMTGRPSIISVKVSSDEEPNSPRNSSETRAADSLTKVAHSQISSESQQILSQIGQILQRSRRVDNANTDKYSDSQQEETHLKDPTTSS
jgi:hypothetical protein